MYMMYKEGKAKWHEWVGWWVVRRGSLQKRLIRKCRWHMPRILIYIFREFHIMLIEQFLPYPILSTRCLKL